MHRWLRMALFMGLLFAFGSPAAPQSAVAAAQRLVVFEGFYNPG